VVLGLLLESPATAMASASCKKPRGGELGLERERRCASAERKRGVFPRPTATFTVAVDLLRRGRSAMAAGPQLHGGEFLGSERKRKRGK
jgi:hypothetical protein